VVLHQERVLLVRLTYSRQAGRYMLPGGYVDPGETIDQAVVREVREETGVDAAVDGLIGVRARVEDGVSNTYCLFQLRYVGGTPRPHGRENDDVRWFSLAELGRDDPVEVVGLARLAATAVLRGETRLIPRRPLPGDWRGFDDERWRVFL